MALNSYNEKIIEAFKANGLEGVIDEQRAEKFRLLSELLIETNKTTNLTAITDEDSIILKHFIDCASASLLIPTNAAVIDVGCGGGFPSLPLAIVRSDIAVISLDSTGKKIDFVKKAIEHLGLQKSEAICARAEEFAVDAREKYDCCISRAVARLNVLAELCLPLVKTGGVFLAMKSEKAQEEFDEATKGIRALGGELSGTRRTTFSYASDSIEREIIIIKKEKATPRQYPRKYSQIIKKPL